MSFDMTDFNTSVRVTKFMQNEEKAAMRKTVKPGMWVKVQGFVKLDRDGSDIIRTAPCRHGRRCGRLSC